MVRVFCHQVANPIGLTEFFRVLFQRQPYLGPAPDFSVDFMVY